MDAEDVSELSAVDHSMQGRIHDWARMWVVPDSRGRLNRPWQAVRFDRSEQNGDTFLFGASPWYLSNNKLYPLVLLVTYNFCARLQSGSARTVIECRLMYNRPVSRFIAIPEEVPGTRGYTYHRRSQEGEASVSATTVIPMDMKKEKWVLPSLSLEARVLHGNTNVVPIVGSAVTALLIRH